jgi:hypothetical protein
LEKSLLDLLISISAGQRFFKPENESDEAKDEFLPIVRRLKELSQRGFIEPLTDRRIIKDHTTGKGHYDIVGPCAITYEGEQVIAEHNKSLTLAKGDVSNTPLNSRYGAVEVSRQFKSNLIRTRLHDLSDNITKDYALLKEYEEHLRLEDDPRRIARYQSEIDRLKASATAFEREYKKLQLQINNASAETSDWETSELQQVHLKVDALLRGHSDILSGLYELRQSILSRYDAGEQRIINSITERLDQGQAETVQTILDAVENDHLNEAEMAEALSAIHQSLVEVSQHNTSLPKSTELEAAISPPHLDVKHKLKVSIPIVPLVLAYEGEVELGSRMNLESVWNRIVNKLRRQ